MAGLKLIKEFFQETKWMLGYGILTFLILKYLSGIFSLFAFIAILTVLFFIYLFRKAEYDLKKIITSVLSNSFPTYSILLAFILFSVYSEWLSNEIDISRNLSLENYIKAANLILVILGIPLVFLISLPRYKPQSGNEEPEPKKVFIGALSKFGCKGKSISEFIKEIEEGKLESSQCNWAPILMSLKRHSEKLEKAYILLSTESSKNKEEFLNALKVLDRVNNLRLSDKIEFRPKDGGISFNDYGEIYNELLSILREIKRNGYRDDDISVYISGGTSAITLALTIFAVKEGRQVEYLIQDEKEKKIVKIDIGPQDIFSLTGEGRIESGF